MKNTILLTYYAAATNVILKNTTSASICPIPVPYAETLSETQLSGDGPLR